jgi:ribosomal protein L29
MLRTAYRNQSSNVLQREIGSLARNSVWKRRGYFGLRFQTVFGVVRPLHEINEIKRIFRIWNCWKDLDYVRYKRIHA